MNVKEQTVNLLNRAVGKSHKTKFVFFSFFFFSLLLKAEKQNQRKSYNIMPY